MFSICFPWKTVFSSPFVSRLLSFVSFCLFLFSFCFASPSISDQLEPSNQKCKGTSAKDWTVIWAPSSVLPFRSWIARSAVARQSKSTFPVQLELPLSSGAQDLLKPHRFNYWQTNNNCNFSENAWNHLAPSCWIHVDRRIANFTYTLAELPQGLRQRVAAEPWACSLKARTFRTIWFDSGRTASNGICYAFAHQGTGDKNLWLQISWGSNSWAPRFLAHLSRKMFWVCANVGVETSYDKLRALSRLCWWHLCWWCLRGHLGGCLCETDMFVMAGFVSTEGSNSPTLLWSIFEWSFAPLDFEPCLHRPHGPLKFQFWMAILHTKWVRKWRTQQERSSQTC